MIADFECVPCIISKIMRNKMLIKDEDLVCCGFCFIVAAVFASVSIFGK